jgi:hypothetical protein
MATITIKINERSKAGKTFKDLIDIFAAQPGIEVVEEKSPYNPAFVKKIKRAHAEKGGKTMTSAAKLWESL